MRWLEKKLRLGFSWLWSVGGLDLKRMNPSGIWLSVLFAILKTFDTFNLDSSQWLFHGNIKRVRWKYISSQQNIVLEKNLFPNTNTKTYRTGAVHHCLGVWLGLAQFGSQTHPTFKWVREPDWFPQKEKIFSGDAPQAFRDLCTAPRALAGSRSHYLAPLSHFIMLDPHKWMHTIWTAPNDDQSYLSRAMSKKTTLRHRSIKELITFPMAAGS